MYCRLKVRMKRFLLIFFILLIVLLAGLAFFYVNNPRKALQLAVPQISDLKQLSLKITGDTLRARPAIILKNKSIFRIHIEQIDLQVYFDGDQILSFQEKQDLDLAAGDSLQHAFPIKIPIKKLRQKIRSLQGQDSAKVRLDGEIRYGTIAGSVRIPVKRELSILVPIPPTFEVKDLQLKGVRWPSIQLLLKLATSNPGKLDLKMTQVKLVVSIEQGLVLTEKNPISFHLKPGLQQDLTVPLILKLVQPFTAIKLFFRRKEPVSYHIKMQGMLRADSLYEGEIPVTFTTQGVRKFN